MAPIARLESMPTERTVREMGLLRSILYVSYLSVESIALRAAS